MRILSFILLFTLVACGNDHKKRKSSGIPFVLVDDNGAPSLITPTPGETGGSTAGGSTTGDSTSGGATTGDSTSGGSTTGDSTSGGSTTGESTSGGATTGESTSGGSTTGEVTDNDDVISDDAQIVKCDFSKDDEKETFILNITKDGNNRYASLSNDNDKEKVVFGGYIFSPSGNENAAVKHVDKDFSIEEGKVIKITARIIFDTHSGVGELQLSYKVKGSKGKVSDTEYRVLSEISNCSEL